MKKYTVIGLSHSEVEEIANELGMEIEIDMGVVGLWKDDAVSYEELQEKLINRINEKYGLDLAVDAKMFGSDGDQYFDFYIGFM